jgi:hypothetical protein
MLLHHVRFRTNFVRHEERLDTDRLKKFLQGEREAQSGETAPLWKKGNRGCDAVARTALEHSTFGGSLPRVYEQL